MPSYTEVAPLLAIGCTSSCLPNLRQDSLGTACATPPGRPNTAITKKQKKKTRIHPPIWSNCPFSKIRLKPEGSGTDLLTDSCRVSSDSCVAADLQMMQKSGRKRPQAPSALLRCISLLLAQSGHANCAKECPWGQSGHRPTRSITH